MSWKYCGLGLQCRFTFNRDLLVTWYSQFQSMMSFGETYINMFYCSTNCWILGRKITSCKRRWGSVQQSNMNHYVRWVSLICLLYTDPCSDVMYCRTGSSQYKNRCSQGSMRIVTFDIINVSWIFKCKKDHDHKVS